MTSDEFKVLGDPGQLSPPLQALWHDAHDNWERAHELAQNAVSREGDWVHAYLHRKEGDEGNARYWYARANRPMFRGSLEKERAAIVKELLVAVV